MILSLSTDHLKLTYHVKVDFVFRALGDNQELLPLYYCPKYWPTFLCFCDQAFTTNFTTNKYINTSILYAEGIIVFR